MLYFSQRDGSLGSSTRNYLNTKVGTMIWKMRIMAVITVSLGQLLLQTASLLRDLCSLRQVVEEPNRYWSMSWTKNWGMKNGWRYPVQRDEQESIVP